MDGISGPKLKEDERQADMQHTPGKRIGMDRLIRHYRHQFEIEENLNYYNYKDFLRAQRKYIKYLLGTHTPYSADQGIS